MGAREVPPSWAPACPTYAAFHFVGGCCHTCRAMSVTVDALRLRRLVDEDPAMRLFRADNAPIALALLTKYLGVGERRLAADEPYERKSRALRT
mgnify:CR=1 FL=1